jgi:iron-sulfur cluster insertion protein|tara:strand:+ start:1325 stop:1672 length:348 start_codon:yes stop_codon:yes gene_type:complete
MKKQQDKSGAISISEKASEIIKSMALDKNCNPNIRIMVVGGGCSGLTYDMDFEDLQNDGDEVYDSYGVKLYVDPISFSYLEDTYIGYTETFAFSGFHFDNPNAQKSCGCGSSFAI